LGAGEVFIAKANFVVTLEQVDAALLNVGFEPRQPELITQVKFLGRSPLAGWVANDCLRPAFTG